MKATHKPGANYGMDYGIIAALLIWIAITIGLLTLLAVKSCGEELCPSVLLSIT
jgi:hypothetical protein